MNYSPIVVFCYNRLNKLEKLINSLKENEEHSQTRVYFFVDYYSRDENVTKKLVEYINSIDFFLEIVVTVRDKEFGLKRNIENGLDTVFELEETVICLEDDLIVSKYFLKYMNDCLNAFYNDKHVWHINGWSYPQIRIDNKNIFFGKLMNSWGWATWRDRWEKHTVRSADLISKLDKGSIKKFNFNNLTNWQQQLSDNTSGKIQTWAIFWYQTIFINKGLTVYPSKALIRNDGMDGSGTNSGLTNIFETNIYNEKPLNINKGKLEEDKTNRLFTKLFYIKLNITKKINYQLKKFKT